MHVLCVLFPWLRLPRCYVPLVAGFRARSKTAANGPYPVVFACLAMGMLYSRSVYILGPYSASAKLIRDPKKEFSSTNVRHVTQPPITVPTHLAYKPRNFALVVHNSPPPTSSHTLSLRVNFEPHSSCPSERISAQSLRKCSHRIPTPSTHRPLMLSPQNSFKLGSRRTTWQFSGIMTRS